MNKLNNLTCIVCKKKSFSVLKTYLNIRYQKCLNCNLHFKTNFRFIDYRKKN